jgi:hypothetical protein
MVNGKSNENEDGSLRSKTKSPNRNKKNRIKKDKISEKLEKSLDLSKNISKLNDNKPKILNQNSIKKRPSSAPTSSSVRGRKDNISEKIKKITSYNNINDNNDRTIKGRDGVAIPPSTKTVKRNDFNSIDVVSNRKQSSLSTTTNKSSIYRSGIINKPNPSNNNIRPKLKISPYLNTLETKIKNISPPNIPIVKIPMVKKDLNFN